MKKQHIICVIVPLLTLLSCMRESVQPEEVTPAALRLENAQLIFAPDGGVDVIHVYGATNLQAKASYDWCTVKVLSDAEVEVTVGPYKDLESRYCPISLTADNAKNSVVIQQSGVYIQGFDSSDLILNNEEREIVLPFNSNATFTAVTKVDWVHLDAQKDKLKINIDENTEKNYREGWIAWAVGELKDTIDVSQFDAADAGLLCEYDFTAYNVKTKKTYTAAASLSAGANGKYNLSIVQGNLNLSIPVTLNKQELRLPLGDEVGTYKTGSTEYAVYPIMIQGTSAVKYDAATTRGYVGFNFAKQEDKTWKADADLSQYAGYNFCFANWKKPVNISGASFNATNSLFFQDMALTQKMSE